MDEALAGRGSHGGRRRHDRRRPTDHEAPVARTVSGADRVAEDLHAMGKAIVSIKSRHGNNNQQEATKIAIHLEMRRRLAPSESAPAEAARQQKHHHETDGARNVEQTADAAGDGR